MLKIMNRVFVTILSVALILPLAACNNSEPSAPMSAVTAFKSAADSDLVKDGKFTYRATEATKDDESATAEYTYSYKDIYFKNPATEYNHDLAVMSLKLAMSAFTEHDGYAEDDINMLSDIGFNDYKPYNYDIRTTDSIAATFAHRTMTFDGVEYETIIIAVRGADYEAEWGGDFRVGTGTVHDGFDRARNQVAEYLDDYIKTTSSIKNGSKLKFWLTGYSRGAATANLMAKTLSDNVPFAAIGGKEFNVLQTDVYAYCFETPNNTTDAGRNDAKYNSIFNIISPYDLIPTVPFTEWGYGKYGRIKFLQSENNSANYIEHEAKVLKTLEEIAAGNNPFNSSAYLKAKSEFTLDDETLISYPVYVNYLSSTLSKLTVSQAHYASNWQADAMNIAQTGLGESSPDIKWVLMNLIALNDIGIALNVIGKVSISSAIANPLNEQEMLALGCVLSAVGHIRYEHYPELILARLEAMDSIPKDALSVNEQKSLMAYITYIHELMLFSKGWQDFSNVSEIDKITVLSGFSEVGNNKARVVPNNGLYDVTDETVKILARKEYETLIKDILNPDFTIGTDVPEDLVYPHYEKDNDIFNFSWAVGGPNKAILDCKYVDGYKSGAEYHIILENYEYVYSPDPFSMFGLMDRVYWNDEIIGEMIYSDTSNTATFDFKWYGEKPVTEYVIRDNGKGGYYLVSKITRDMSASSVGTEISGSQTQVNSKAAYRAYYDVLKGEVDRRGLFSEQNRIESAGYTFGESVCYAQLIDFDNNGVDELLYGYTNGDGLAPRYVVYGFSNGSIVKLIDDTMDSSGGDPSFGISITTDVNGVKYVETQHNNGSYQSSNEYATVQGGDKWLKSAYFLYTCYEDVGEEYFLNDIPIAKNEYDLEISKYNRSVLPVELSAENVAEILKILGGEKVANQTAPASDYSSAYAEHLKNILNGTSVDAAEYKFAMRDIDGNGTDELLLSHMLPDGGQGAGGISETLIFYTFDTDVIKIPFPSYEYENYKGEIQRYTPEQIELSSMDGVYTVENSKTPGVFYTTSGIGGGAVSYVTVSNGEIDDKAIYEYTDGSPEYPEDASENVYDTALYTAYNNSSQQINWHLLNMENIAAIFME
ncbi:MAG: hypothetical protein LBR74_04180 [Eubacterium sp.]|jgi:hypothetical protein|nr:hypothetical protein [Eubacterium sp.]